MLWGIAAILLAVAGYLFLIAPAWRPKKQVALWRPWYYAHRGLHDDASPENSLSAFQKAVDHGYGMELDVRLTKDRQMVVMHDGNLLRMCGVDRHVKAVTLDEFRRCRLLGTLESPPTLDEVLSAVDGKTPLIIEMKSDGPQSKQLPPQLYRRMQSYGGMWCVESFDPRLICWFKRHAPHVIRGQLAFDPARLGDREHRGFAFWCGARMLMNFLSRPDFVAYAYESEGNYSLKAMRILFRPWMAAWTVRSNEDLKNLKGRYDLMIFEAFEPKIFRNTNPQQEKEKPK